MRLTILFFCCFFKLNYLYSVNNCNKRDFKYHLDTISTEAMLFNATIINYHQRDYSHSVKINVSNLSTNYVIDRSYLLAVVPY